MKVDTNVKKDGADEKHDPEKLYMCEKCGCEYAYGRLPVEQDHGTQSGVEGTQSVGGLASRKHSGLCKWDSFVGTTRLLSQEACKIHGSKLIAGMEKALKADGWRCLEGKAWSKAVYGAEGMVVPSVGGLKRRATRDHMSKHLMADLVGHCEDTC